MTRLKPFLKWAGGKRLLLGLMSEYINKDTLNGHTYYEPFVGGGSLFLNLEHTKCVINDLNSEVINVYTQIKDNLPELLEQLKCLSSQHNKENYYKIRMLDRQSGFDNLDNVFKAARTIYLNKTCYNGLYRVNSSGYFNTPLGSYSNPRIFDEENLKAISEYFNSTDIKIMNTSYDKVLNDASEGDIVYFDPPYDYENENGFVAYVKEGFVREDLIKLKAVCDDLINRGCKVFISNNATSFVLETFRYGPYEIKYDKRHILANRNINSNPKKRNKVKEVLIIGKR